jgi:hypothetical protein
MLIVIEDTFSAFVLISFYKMKVREENSSLAKSLTFKNNFTDLDARTF